MNIAVYGDSFACASPLKTVDASWPALLGRSHSVINYSVTGSSLYHQFSQFIHNYRGSDRVIFLITQWGRLWLPHHSHSHMANIHTAQALEATSREPARTQLKQVIDYFTHIQVDHQEQTFHNLLVAEIQRLRPDALLIPCFDTSILGQENACTMMDLQAIDLMHYGLDFSQGQQGQELRHCHLNDENNQLLAHKLAHWAETGSFDLLATDFVTPSADVSWYFDFS
jgi:hypothetical protein